jgi:putative endonuclease
MEQSTQNSCYILFSETLDKYYVGFTTEGAIKRLEKHNTSFYGHHYTSKAKDWKIVLEIKCSTASTARKMELYIKQMKSRKFILKLLTDEEELNIFIKKFEGN